MPMVIVMVLILVGDFPVCTAPRDQYYPSVTYANDQFYVFWSDRRYYPSYAIFGARVTKDGAVLDPDGKLIFRDESAYDVNAAYDGSNFLVVFRNGC